jgi:hypothetical protein
VKKIVVIVAGLDKKRVKSFGIEKETIDSFSKAKAKACKV